MTTSPRKPSTLDHLASCYLHDPRNAALRPQLAHRLNLASAWGIEEGWSVLDIGCGSGDSTLALAEAVGPAGHVTGIDPGSPDASPAPGMPTLGQSQAYILRSRLGPRISFQRADAPGFIAGLEDDASALSMGKKDDEPTSFDAATLCHSLWYFDSRSTVQRLFEALARGRVRRVLLAEYTGEARTPAQEPHALAAQVQVQFYHAQERGEGEGPILPGVREALRPAEIVREAQAAGWRVAAEGVVHAPEGCLDGKSEVAGVLEPGFMARLMSFGVRGTTAEMLGMVQEIRGMRDALAHDGQDVDTMDVAWVVLEMGAGKA